MTTNVAHRRRIINPYELTLWILVAIALLVAGAFWIVVQVQASLLAGDLMLLQTKDQPNAIGIPEIGYAPMTPLWARPLAAAAPVLLAFGAILATALLFVRMVRWRAPR